MALKIPEADRHKLSKFLKLKEDTLDALYEALKASAPHLQPRALVKDIQGRVPIDTPTLREIVRMLLTLYWIRTNQGLEASQVAEELCAAAQDSGDEMLKTPEVGWDEFKSRLTALLSLDHSILVTAKSAFVAYQFPRHLHRARILTDARPVFGTTVSDGPSAFIINHILQMEIHEEGKDREWFVALNSIDLEDLKAVIERALAKETSLRTLLAKTDVPTLMWEDD